MTYLIAAIAAVLAGLIYALWRERRWLRREQTLRGLLDMADTLEQQLLSCRERMQTLRGMLVDLPEEMTGDADEALASDHKVQAALRDLLQHRLWIQQHATTAHQAELDIALDALRQSRASMGQQLERLDEITAALRQAQARSALVPVTG
jgi:flagellin-like hook-associated protein FlgL